MQRLRKLRDLSGRDRALLAHAGLLVLAARLGLWVLPFRLLRRLAEGAPARSAGARPAPERIGWAVQVASSCVPRATCLSQALAAQRLMRRHGYPAALRIGVMRDGAGQIAAHAWVESGGAVIVGGTPASLAPFAVLGPQPGRGQ